MAIEKVKRAWFLVERGELGSLIQALADSKTTHVVDLKEEPQAAGQEEASPAGQLFLSPNQSSGSAAAAEKVNKLSRVLDVLDAFAPPKRRFHENFVNLPAEMRSEEFERSVAEVRVDQLYERVTAINREHAAATKKADELRSRTDQLEPWAEAMAPPAGLRRCGADLGTVPARLLPKLQHTVGESETIAVQVALTVKSATLVAAVWLRGADGDGDDSAPELLEEHGFESLGLEPGAGKIADVVKNLRTELAVAEAQGDELTQQAASVAETRRAVLAAHAYWQAEVERGATSGKTLASNRIAILSGYVRVRELKKLEDLLSRDFPSVSLVALDPQPGEDVPVSLGGSKLFAPAQFLTSMFGLPNYFEFDPSPYIFFTFLVFFGFCFGDVVYGLMLFALGWWLARKSRDYPSLARFFGLLMWGGVASIVVGLITQSWAADLFAADPVSGEAKYLGGGPLASAFVRMQQKLTLVNPLKKTVLVLGVALVLGMFNQFYGMMLLMYREWRKGHYFAAVCDGGLWLVFLPGLLLLLGGAAASLDPVWAQVALGMVAVSGVGLVLTQGRREKTFLGKAITGVVSLYGILGTYGTTSFIGDMLSYSRLLALGLTTYIIGFSINIIAELLTGIPWVGWGLCVLAVIGGHCGNFLISILGGFVHSARLIFVEFFTKFYEGSAKPFAPLGAPQTVRVIDDR